MCYRQMLVLRKNDGFDGTYKESFDSQPERANQEVDREEAKDTMIRSETKIKIAKKEYKHHSYDIGSRFSFRSIAQGKNKLQIIRWSGISCRGKAYLKGKECEIYQFEDKVDPVCLMSGEPSDESRFSIYLQ